MLLLTSGLMLISHCKAKDVDARTWHPGETAQPNFHSLDSID